MTRSLLVRYALGLMSVLILIADSSLCQSARVTNLTRKADIVAIGRVSSLKSEWTPDKSRIQTRITLAVDTYVKGSAGDTMDIVVPGGEIGAVGEIYSHMPRFTIHEDVVVFAERDTGGHLRVSGGDEGKFEVKKDIRTGVRMVGERMSLEEFTAQIRAATK
jgi:hypothetical protein